MLLRRVVVMLALAVPPLFGVAATLLGERVPPLGGLLIRRYNTLLIVEPEGGAEWVLESMLGERVVGNVAVSPDSRSVAFTQGEFGDARWGTDLYVIDFRLSESVSVPGQ